jgi:hypothetical protein
VCKNQLMLPFFSDEVGIKIVPAPRLQEIGDRIEELNADVKDFACRFIANHVPRLDAGSES